MEPKGIGPGYKDKRTIDISADDYRNDEGFAVQAVDAGDLTYRTLAGNADQTETLVAGATLAGPGDGLVLCRIVRGGVANGVTSIVVGIFVE